MSEQALYGAARPASVCHHLRAGPVRVKFQDGELRYLHVGGKQIVRRVYFAVRDAEWDTAMPQFTKMDVRPSDDSFVVDMEAVCRLGPVHYEWKGRIEGGSDGKITIDVDGCAKSDFESPRIGVCLLYGAESLSGQAFELVKGDGSRSPGAFPKLISPGLVATTFRWLRYRTDSGVEVRCGLEEGLFDMEDQRNFGDSSFKAFTRHPYTSDDIKKGDSGRQVFTIEVNAPAAAVTDEPSGPIRISAAASSPTGRIPRLLPASESAPDAAEYSEPNRNRPDFVDKEKITFALTSAAHLWDDDTLMENPTAVVDQVRTLKSFEPKATVRVDPVLFDPPYQRTDLDPRNRGLFAAAWCARMLKYLALAGVDEAVFIVDGPYAKVVLDMLSTSQGAAVSATDAAPHGPVDAFVVGDGRQRTLWLVNKTAEPHAVEVLFDGAANKLALQRLGAQSRSMQRSSVAADGSHGAASLVLEPFEVVVATAGG